MLIPRPALVALPLVLVPPSAHAPAVPLPPAGLGVYLPSSTADSSRCSLHYQRVPVGQRKVAVCSGGTRGGGPLVVFESGLGDGMESWRELADSVSRFARVLAYDRAGLGDSDPNPGVRDATRVAAELEALLARLGERGPVVVVAHSLGGPYARVFAATHRRQVRGLVLLDPTPEDFADRRRAELGEERYRAVTAATESRLSGTALAEWQGLAATAAEARRDGWPSPGSAAVLSSGRIANPDPVLGPRLKQIWLQLHRELAERLGAVHEVLPDAGHYLQRDDPVRVVAAIRRVVAAVGHGR